MHEQDYLSPEVSRLRADLALATQRSTLQGGSGDVAGTAIGIGRVWRAQIGVRLVADQVPDLVAVNRQGG